jgi:16S rRNA processing protein RimM
MLRDVPGMSASERPPVTFCLMTTPHWIVLAHILRPQGRKGEVLADLLTDFPERFGERRQVWLAPPGFDGPASGVPPVDVVSFFLPVGRNAGRVVLQLSGVDRIEDAQALAGQEIVVPLAERTTLDHAADPDAAYISDLVGCTVYDGDAAIGVVADVQFPTTPDGARRLEDAAPLLAVTSTAGDEVLVPFAKAFLVDIDLAGRSIRMRLPSGLIELNR